MSSTPGLLMEDRLGLVESLSSVRHQDATGVVERDHVFSTFMRCLALCEGVA
jgi:hypothetical protein